MTHTMTMVEGNAIEGVWQCLECPRRVIYNFGPQTERTILDHGEEGVQHAGSIAPEGLQLRMGTVRVSS